MSVNRSAEVRIVVRHLFSTRFLMEGAHKEANYSAAIAVVTCFPTGEKRALISDLYFAQTDQNHSIYQNWDIDVYA